MALGGTEVDVAQALKKAFEEYALTAPVLRPATAPPAAAAPPPPPPEQQTPQTTAIGTHSLEHNFVTIQFADDASCDINLILHLKYAICLLLNRCCGGS